MKIRNGYVSNSSSSSWVVLDSLKGIHEVEATQEEIFSNYEAKKGEVYKWYVCNHPMEVDIINSFNKNITFIEIHSLLRDGKTLQDIIFSDDDVVEDMSSIEDEIIDEMTRLGISERQYLKKYCEMNNSSKEMREKDFLYNLIKGY
jgi:hypothetical protein